MARRHSGTIVPRPQVESVRWILPPLQAYGARNEARLDQQVTQPASEGTGEEATGPTPPRLSLSLSCSTLALVMLYEIAKTYLKAQTRPEKLWSHFCPSALRTPRQLQLDFFYRFKHADLE